MVIKDFLDLNQEGFYKWEAIEKTPEFERMKGCEQNPYWHAEGDVWEHTKKVCEEAIMVIKGLTKAETNPDFFNDDEKEILLTAALFHDIGKPITSSVGKDGKIHSYGHETEGEKLTRYILWEEDMRKREKVCALIKWHMDILELFKHKNYLERILVIAKEVSDFKILIALKYCDLRGSETSDPERQQSYKTLAAIGRMGMLLCNNKTYLALPLYNQLTQYVGTEMQDVYVMIGLPGAGKSTFIDYIVKDKKLKDYAVISRDLVRAKLGLCKNDEKYLGTPEEEEKVTEEFNRLLIDAVRKGYTVFIDNMNNRRKYRDGYKNLLKGYKIKWIYIYVQAPTLKDNISRRKGQIPEESFKPMVTRFEWPSVDEYNELYVRITK